MAAVKGVLGRAMDKVRGMEQSQKVVAALALGAIIIFGAFLYNQATRTNLTPLYTGLSGQDASAVVEQLRADGIPYELTQGGSTILVPEDHVYDQRLKASAAGLSTSSNGGYSLLDDMGVTSSEFQQDVTYKRAMEGELAATIEAMDGVETASVRLAVPEESVFVAEKQDPTASVFVRPARGVALTNDQVQAIVHLTSSSIDGMSPDDVAVVAADGTVLSAVGVGAVGGADKQASDYETRVAANVQQMLDRVVGAGNATVAVAADMNYQSGERLEETFENPEGNPALSEQTTTEQYEGTGGTAAGVLGPDNIAVPGGQGGEGSFSSENTNRTNAVNKVTETITIPAGEINRQTVSVAVDQQAAAAVDPATLTDLVASAAGVNEERGDVVTVEVIPFSTLDADAAAEALAEAEAAAAAAAEAEQMRNLAIIAAVVVLALILAIVTAARRRRRTRAEALDVGEANTVVIEQDDPAVAELAATPPTSKLLEREPVGVEEKLSEVSAMAITDPARTAAYMRTLMHDKAGAR